MFRKLAHMLQVRSHSEPAVQPLARPSSPMDFACPGLPADDEDTPPRNLALEALSLEPIIAQSLRPMQPLVVTHEQLATRAAVASRRASVTSLADQVRDGLSLGAMGPAQAYGLLHSPLPTPEDERSDPFDTEANPLVRITELPMRQQRAKKAISLRLKREMPLRVQAIRRSHQQAFAQALLQHMQIQADEQARRHTSPNIHAPAPTSPTVPSRLMQNRPRAASQWDASGGQPFIALTWGQQAEGGHQGHDLFAADFSMAGTPTPGHRITPPTQYVAPHHTPPGDPSGGDDTPREEEITIFPPRSYGTPF